MGAAAVADTYELIRQAIAKVIGAAGGGDALPKKLRRAANGIVNGKARIDWADRAARRSELGRLVGVAGKVLAATARNDELAEARSLLERIIDQDVEATPEDGGGPGIRQGVALDRQHHVECRLHAVCAAAGLGGDRGVVPAVARGQRVSVTRWPYAAAWRTACPACHVPSCWWMISL